MQTILPLKLKNLRCSTVGEGRLLLYPSSILPQRKKGIFKLTFHHHTLFIKHNRCFSTLPLLRFHHNSFQSGSRIPKQTIIFTKMTLLLAVQFQSFTLPSSLASIEEFLEKIDRKYHNPNLLIILQELLLNALEYGSFQISATQKERLIEENRYTRLLAQQTNQKKIYVRIAHIASFLVVQIEDEGEGFDAHNLQIHNRLFSGRGILLAKRLAFALAYNTKGNCATFLYRITP